MIVKTPPQCIEAEESLLAACLINPSILFKLVAVLSRWDFFGTLNAQIIQTMFKLGDTLDLFKLVAAWEEDFPGQDLEAFIKHSASLLDKVSTTDSWQKLANSVLEMSLRRELIDLANKWIEACLEEKKSFEAIKLELINGIYKIDRRSRLMFVE